MDDEARPTLREVAAAEVLELDRASHALGPFWVTAEQTVVAYVAVAEAIERVMFTREPKDKVKAKARAGRCAVGNLFLRAAARSCRLDYLALARRHWPEALSIRRRAFEYVAYTRIIWNEPLAHEMVHAWLQTPPSGDGPLVAERGGSSEGARGTDPWARYQHLFQSSRIRDALRQLHEGLDVMYDSMSGRIHPSLQGTVLMRSQESRLEAHALDRVGMFDGASFKADGMITSLLVEWFLDCEQAHLFLLDGFVGRALAGSGWNRAQREVAPVLADLAARVDRDEELAKPHQAALRLYRKMKRAESR